MYACTSFRARGVLKFGFGRDVPPRNLKVDPYKYPGGGGHLYFRLDIIRVKGFSKHTLNT